MHSSRRPCFKTTLALNVAWRYDVALHKHWRGQTSKTSSEFFRALSSILDLWDWGEFLGLVGEVRSLDADDGLILCLMCGTFEFFCKEQQEVENLESRYEEVDDIAKNQYKSRLASINMLTKQTSVKADTGKQTQNIWYVTSWVTEIIYLHVSNLS